MDSAGFQLWMAVWLTRKLLQDIPIQLCPGVMAQL
jgi:hypothetical protein